MYAIAKLQRWTSNLSIYLWNVWGKLGNTKGIWKLEHPKQRYYRLPWMSAAVIGIQWKPFTDRSKKISTTGSKSSKWVTISVGDFIQPPEILTRSDHSNNYFSQQPVAMPTHLYLVLWYHAWVTHRIHFGLIWGMFRPNCELSVLLSVHWSRCAVRY